ncbi:MAG: hypothetical protein WA364_06440 [Candidatus Nitrosopolaris sp.]
MDTKTSIIALLLILFIIPIIIEDINIPLPKDIEKYSCTVDDGVLFNGNCVPVMR